MEQVVNEFVPIVCIPSTAKIQVESKSHVLHIDELNETILSYKEKIIDNYREIYKIIDSLNIVDRDKRKKHVEYAKKIKDNQSVNGEEYCPKCGGKLIKRRGKYGDFVGCSNYPKCKYTRKVK